MDARKTRVVRLGIGTGFLMIVCGVAAFHFDVRGEMDRVLAVVRTAGPLPFFTAMALLPAVGFPLSAFTLAAGPVFGPTMGVGQVVLCGILAITVNVGLSYWVAARGLRPLVESVVRWLGYRLPDIPARSTWSAILILRMVPLTPFCLQGMLLGLARVPFGPYMLVSVLVPSGYAAAAITLGDAVMRGDRWAMAGAGALFVVVGVILHIVRKRLRRHDAAPATPPAGPQRS